MGTSSHRCGCHALVGVVAATGRDIWQIKSQHHHSIHSTRSDQDDCIPAPVSFRICSDVWLARAGKGERECMSRQLRKLNVLDYNAMGHQADESSIATTFGDALPFLG